MKITDEICKLLSLNIIWIKLQRHRFPWPNIIQTSVLRQLKESVLGFGRDSVDIKTNLTSSIFLQTWMLLPFLGHCGYDQIHMVLISAQKQSERSFICNSRCAGNKTLISTVYLYFQLWERISSTESPAVRCTCEQLVWIELSAYFSETTPPTHTPYSCVEMAQVITKHVAELRCELCVKIKHNWKWLSVSILWKLAWFL